MKLCKIASEYTKIKVRGMYFNELSIVNKYNGIWACSSILHLSLDDLVDVFKRMSKALKDEGIIYTSFKYRKYSGEQTAEYYTDMTEGCICKIDCQCRQSESRRTMDNSRRKTTARK